MRQCLLPAALLALLVSPAHAEETSLSKKGASITVERHSTSNALDSDLRVDDRYTLLRGSLEHDVPIQHGAVKLKAQFQASVFDHYDIENDRALALSLDATRKIGETFEIRGTLSWRRFSEGDDLRVGSLVLGTRTVTDTLAAAAQLGVDLGAGKALILGLSDRFETPGLTRFQQDVIAPLRLNPQRNTVGLSIAVTKTAGATAYGIKAAADVSRADAPPVGVSYVRYGLRGEARSKTPDGTVIAAAFGAEWLRAQDGLFDDLRPSLELTAVKRLENGIELRGSYAQAYVTEDTDDPLASWVRRLEIEAKAPLSPKLLLAGGYFAEQRENLLLGYDEHSQGVYGKLAYAVAAQTAIVFRLDYKRDFLTVVDVEKPVLDAYVGLTQKL